jgi:hypothetical protein
MNNCKRLPVSMPAAAFFVGLAAIGRAELPMQNPVFLGETSSLSGRVKELR